jgi:thiamine-phosphate pyrophosphorylase
LEAVVQANCKRAQEALRSLEEYGKIHSPDLGRALEKLRYKSYTLERALILGSLARERLADARLCVLVTDSECLEPLEWTVKEAAAGGAAMVQLREKRMGDKELLETARKIRRWTKEAEVLFIVNDRADVARLVEADGVHLGQDDMPVMEARQILGSERLIGVSTHCLDQVRRAVLDGASYIGAGPTFPSATKEFAEYPGLGFVREASLLTSLPTFVIGGVTSENIAQAIAAGATRVAVSQAICKTTEPRQAAKELRRVLSQARLTRETV